MRWLIALCAVLVGVEAEAAPFGLADAGGGVRGTYSFSVSVNDGFTQVSRSVRDENNQVRQFGDGLTVQSIGGSAEEVGVFAPLLEVRSVDIALGGGVFDLEFPVIGAVQLVVDRFDLGIQGGPATDEDNLLRDVEGLQSAQGVRSTNVLTGRLETPFGVIPIDASSERVDTNSFRFEWDRMVGFPDRLSVVSGRGTDFSSSSAFSDLGGFSWLVQGSADFDRVDLVETSVIPEPSTALLMGLGLLGLAAVKS